MASGRLDLYIADVPPNTIVLTLNCNGTSELMSIPRGTQAQLVRGTLKQSVRLQFLEGRECFADFAEMNLALAKRFQLSALRRYSFEYQPSSRLLTVRPAPISASVTQILPGKLGADRISVGYELLSRLGIPERQGMRIGIRCGEHTASLRLTIPANLSDDKLRLPAGWLNKCKLAAGTMRNVQFDQRSSSLTLYM